MDSTMSPCLDDFKLLMHDEKIIEYIVPAPENLPCILKN